MILAIAQLTKRKCIPLLELKHKYISFLKFMKKLFKLLFTKGSLCEIKRENNWLKSKFEMFVYS